MNTIMPNERYFYYKGQHISHREGEVLLACAKGLTIEQSAEKLFVSPSTIKRHRENLRLRFSLQGYSALVCFTSKLEPDLEKWVK